MKNVNTYGLNVAAFTILGLIGGYLNAEVDVTKDHHSEINWWWGLGGAVLGTAMASIELKVADWYFPKPKFDWIDAETTRLRETNQSVRKKITEISFVSR